MYGMSQGSGGYAGCSNCSSCGNCYSSGSGLEYIASSSRSYEGAAGSSSGVFAYEVASGVSRGNYGGGEIMSLIRAGYSGDSGAERGYEAGAMVYEFGRAEKNYHFAPEDFLIPGREGRFVGKAEEVREVVEEAFTKIFDCPFPNDVKVSVLSDKKFRKIANSPGVLGLSFNRKLTGGVSEIYVREDSLARVMLTLGHELGHVLTATLGDKRDEEAKAYAFSLEWMRMLQEENIGGLGGALVLDRPAENGLHNVAFEFVQKMVASGRKAWEVYLGMVNKVWSTENYFN